MNGDEPKEIVIVRRRHSDDHDEPHGGVWKVAFADFMTALMAFFLVLWIVNSTSKETRASVARYFNPVRLSDTTPARKGLQEPREEDFDAAAKEIGKAEMSKPENSKPESSKPEAGKASAPPRDDALAADAHPALATAESRPKPSDETRAGQRVVETFQDPFETSSPGKDASTVTAAALTQSDPAAAKTAAPGNGAAEAAALDRALQTIAKTAGAGRGPTVDVRATSEGVLISLTDRADFGMFAVGSTEANAALVKLVTELGGILKPLRSTIVVRGYTDARRYRKAGNDNWRLSTGRAQSACDLLLRGGVDERRIARIEGHADRNLKNPADPEAAENRRVEILLRKDGA